MERIWETWFATLMLAVLFWLTLRLQEEDSWPLWLGWGLLWGVAAMTSPAVLTVLAVLGVWLLVQRHRVGRPWLWRNVAAGLVFAAVISPWFVRNYQVFHRVIPFRDGIGLVLRLGTQGKSDYWATYELGPWHNDAEWAEFQQLGELGYMDHKGQQAQQFIAARPEWYAWTSLRRAVFIWTGYWSFDQAYLAEEPFDPPNIVLCTPLTILLLLGLWRLFRRDRRLGWAFALTLFTFPLVYYITSPEVYYRRPVDPLCVVLAAGAVAEWRHKPALTAAAPAGDLAAGA